MRRAFWLGLVALAAACSTTPRYPTMTPTTPTTPAAPAAPTPLPQQSARPQRGQAGANDQCGASALQGLVGRPRTEVPVPVNPNLQRVACTTCPVTMDYSPQRLNFFFDAQTGIIKEIRCG